jgi:LPS O-antigen subunit length determinant protein (WzzB/FepE family)
MTIEQEAFEPRSRDSSVVIADYLKRSISVSEILDQLWSGRVIIILCFVLGMLYGAYSAWTQGPHFVAEMNLLPAESNSVDGNSSSSGALGLIAGLTGTNLGSVPKFTQFLSALHSTAVAQILDKKYDMTCRVFAGYCDQQTHQWARRDGMRAWVNGVLASLSGLPDPNGPFTPAELAQYIYGSVEVTVDKANQVVKLGYQSPKPKFAAEFLTVLVQTTNDYIKNQDRTVLRQYVNYLANQAATTTNVAQRDAIDQLLLQQERKLMLSEVNVPYAASVLDGPTVMPVNKAPKIIAMYSALGLAIGVLITLGRRRLNLRFWSRRA